MSKGKKNYFRHSVNLRKDPKIMALITTFGKEAYYHYMALLEMCATVVVDAGYPDSGTFIFHKRTVCGELMVTPQRLSGHLLAIQSSLLGDLVVTGERVEIKFPNLRKYIGRYEIEIEVEDANKKKRKEKKIKESITPTPIQNLKDYFGSNFISSEQETLIEDDAKKILPEGEPLNFRNSQIEKSYPKFTPDHVVDLWNQRMGAKHGHAVGLGSGKHLMNCLESLKFLPDQAAWENLFAKCSESAFLRGERTDWSVTLTWIVNYDNAVRVLSDEFNDMKHIQDLFSKIKPEASA